MRPTFRADLHCHTTCSDGAISPHEIVAMAIQVGLQGLCITDHDTIAAYEQALPVAKRAGLLLGTGVEFSAEHLGQNIHILGYGFAVDDPRILEFCQRHQVRRLERNRKILEKLRYYGMPIEEKELLGEGTIGRPHIAAAMVSRRYVKDEREAFRRFLGDGQCCYEKRGWFSAEETIAVLHGASGKAFLAHPQLISSIEFVQKVLMLPFDGLECYYARCSIAEEWRWVQLARSRGLLQSGGSDFHGEPSSRVSLGTRWVDRDVFEAIFGGVDV